jgi:hypothetical protein
MRMACRLQMLIMHLGFRSLRDVWSERCNPAAAYRWTHGGIKAREIECRGGACALGTDAISRSPQTTPQN